MKIWMHQVAFNFELFSTFFLQCSVNIKIKIITIFGHLIFSIPSYVLFLVLMTLVILEIVVGEKIAINETMRGLSKLLTGRVFPHSVRFWINSPQNLKTGLTLQEAAGALNELFGCEWHKHSKLSKDYWNMKHFKCYVRQSNQIKPHQLHSAELQSVWRWRSLFGH